jgi:hypothetical protein
MVTTGGPAVNEGRHNHAGAAMAFVIAASLNFRATLQMADAGKPHSIASF